MMSIESQELVCSTFSEIKSSVQITKSICKTVSLWEIKPVDPISGARQNDVTIRMLTWNSLETSGLIFTPQSSFSWQKNLLELVKIATMKRAEANQNQRRKEERVLVWMTSSRYQEVKVGNHQVIEKRGPNLKMSFLDHVYTVDKKVILQGIVIWVIASLVEDRDILRGAALKEEEIETIVKNLEVEEKEAVDTGLLPDVEEDALVGGEKIGIKIGVVEEGDIEAIRLHQVLADLIT
jgi:hypothetical protein